MEIINESVSFRVTSIGDGLEYDATVTLPDGYIAKPITHGFDSGYIFSNEEIILLALMEKYPELAKSKSVGIV